MRGFRRVAVPLFVAGALGWPGGVPATYAQVPEDTRVVEGQIVNGTVGGGSVDGLAVVFHEEGISRHDHRRANSDADGRFMFDEIVFDTEIQYGVSVDYRGALYGTDLDLSQGSPPASITVYEATDAEGTLTVSIASILITEVDEASQRVRTLEIAKLVNATNRTYVPGPDPMGMVRFGLPSGAQGLQVSTNLLGADVLQVDVGFAITGGVPPGEHDVMYAYDFPFSASQASFARSFRYGAGSVRVLVPLEVARISSRDLEGPESVDIGSRSYQLLTASDVPRGSRISFDLLDLPRASLGDRLGRRAGQVPMEYIAPAGLLLLMTALIGLALWMRGLARPALASGTGEAVGDEVERDRIIHEIAELEDNYEVGGLSETQYRRRRQALMARMAALATRGAARPG